MSHNKKFVTLYCLGESSKKKINIPLRHVQIINDIYNDICQSTIIQQYVNNENNPIETYYEFPMPSKSSVYSFEAKIKNDTEEKTIISILKEKETAQKEYNAAIKNGDSAFLMETTGDDIFSICLGNIPPKSNITITIKLCKQLVNQISDNSYRYNIPITIFPKFTPITQKNPHHYTTSSTQDIDYVIEIIGKLKLCGGIKSFTSKIGDIKFFNMNEQGCEYKISNFDHGSDVTILFETNLSSSYALTESINNMNYINDSAFNDKYAYASMINIIMEPDTVQKMHPSKLHFYMILDRSGSMQNSMQALRDATILLLNLLPIESSFDIIHFGSDYKKYSHANLDDINVAKQWVKNISSYGGTEIKIPFEVAMADIKCSEKHGIILFLTDGQVTNVDEITTIVKSNPDTRVFTIGIGNDVSEHLVNELAIAGRGIAEFLTNANDDLDEKITAQLFRSQTGFDNKYKIDIVTDGDYIIVPSKLPCLYENFNNKFYIFSQKNIAQIMYNGNNIAIENVDDFFHDAPLHKIIAEKYITDISNKKIASGSKIPHIRDNSIDVNYSLALKKTIIEISLNNNILTKYTSFIGVDVLPDNEKINEDSKLRIIPLSRPVTESYVAESCMVSQLNVSKILSQCKNSSTCRDTSTRTVITSDPNVYLDDIYLDSFYVPMGSCGNMPAAAAAGAAPPSYNYSVPDQESDESDEDMGYGLFGSSPPKKSKYNTRSDTRSDSRSDTRSDSRSDSRSDNKNNFTGNIKKEIDDLNGNYKFDNGYIISNKNEFILTIIPDVSNGDYISIKNGNYRGIYKVVSIGSNITPWILKKMN